MSNSLSVHQFKEEYQKLIKECDKISKDTEQILRQKMSESTSTIIELKKIDFTFTHPSNHNLQTKYGAIVGIDEKYLYVYCANGNPVVHLIDSTTNNIDDAPTMLLSDFADSLDVYFDVEFALRGLESLEEQMRNCLTSLDEQVKQRRQVLDSRLNSNS